MRKLILILLVGYMLAPASVMAQKNAIEAEPICWNYNGVDSSLNRYVLVSSRSNQRITLFYHDAYQNIVDVSAGGSFSFGYCDTLCGISEVTIDTFQLNGSTLELVINGGDKSTVDLSGLGTITSPPIRGQSTAPVNTREFFKDTDSAEDSLRVQAPYGDQGFKELAYHEETQADLEVLRKAVIFQGKAILDTIPIIAGIDQTRLDSMGLIGLSSNTSGWHASTAARDTLYPDAFAFQIHNSDSVIIAYSGILVFPDSVFDRGVNYYQPYDFKKYQSTPDSILEQLVFKAIDTNKIEIRDRYSLLTDGYNQSDRIIPEFNITVESFTDNEVAFILVPDADYSSLSGGEIVSYTDPYNSISFTGGTFPGNRPDLVSTFPAYIGFTDGTGEVISTLSSGLDTVFTVVVKFELAADNVDGSQHFVYGRRSGTNNGFNNYVNNVMRLQLGASGGDETQNHNYTVLADTPYIYATTHDPSNGATIRGFLASTKAEVGSKVTSSIYTEGADYSGLVFGARNIASSNMNGKIYGAYVFKGVLTDQEINDLVSNWDLYHKY